jgi:thioredoxin reductase/polyferredoxin
VNRSASEASAPAGARWFDRFTPRRVRESLQTILESGEGDSRRPALGRGNESSVQGLHVIGDLAGAPVIKLAMAQGVEVIDYLASLPEMKEPAASSGDPELLDVLVVGAGASGLNAALAAKERGWRCAVLEKERIANTIDQFPEGKWVYAEPDAVPPKGKLWLDGAEKEELVARWKQIVRDNGLDVRTEQPLLKLERRDGRFAATTPKGTLHAKKVVLATGQRGNPRKLGVAGEELGHVYHRLYSPRKYHDESLLVVGGGNSAIEAALTLSERNRVVLSYRGGEFGRVFKENQKKLDAAIAARRIDVVFNSRVSEFRSDEATLVIDRGGHREERVVATDHAFVLVGAELPVAFLRSLGIRLENEWEGRPGRALLLVVAALFGLCWFGQWFGAEARFTGFGASWLGVTLRQALELPGWEWLAKPLSGVDGSGFWIGFVPWWGGAALTLVALAMLVRTGLRGDRWSWLGLSFLVWHTVYGAKVGGSDPELALWPFTGWGYQALSFAGRGWSFWYTLIYTVLMTVFGLRALKRWGLERKDRFQVWRYASLLAFQWILFFLVPEFLFQWAVKYQWVGEQLATDPQFAAAPWRTYGLVYAWPLFFFTFLHSPHQVWVVWGVLLTFVVIPLLVLFQGKRYCSWICGCGGLAETFGDRWRHLAPKGKAAIRLEVMGLWVLLAATAVTLLILARDGLKLGSWLLRAENPGAFHRPAELGMRLYTVIADVWLVGILPVTLYPFLGGKVWCRYWCPLAKLMQYVSKFWTRLGWSRFRIVSNDKCIACGECSRNCQVGIPVMQYALKQDVLDNETSSCIGCGICVTVCPMDTLSFARDEHGKAKLLPVVTK